MSENSCGQNLQCAPKSVTLTIGGKPIVSVSDVTFDVHPTEVRAMDANGHIYRAKGTVFLGVEASEKLKEFLGLSPFTYYSIGYAGQLGAIDRNEAKRRREWRRLARLKSRRRQKAGHGR